MLPAPDGVAHYPIGSTTLQSYFASEMHIFSQHHLQITVYEVPIHHETVFLTSHMNRCATPCDQ
jgi:hypothetical protein